MSQTKPLDIKLVTKFSGAASEIYAKYGAYGKAHAPRSLVNLAARFEQRPKGVLYVHKKVDLLKMTLAQAVKKFGSNASVTSLPRSTGSNGGLLKEKAGPKDQRQFQALLTKIDAWYRKTAVYILRTEIREHADDIECLTKEIEDLRRDCEQDIKRMQLDIAADQAAIESRRRQLFEQWGVVSEFKIAG